QTILQRCNAHCLFEYFAEIGYVAEPDVLGNLLDGMLGRFKQSARLLYSENSHIFAYGAACRFFEQARQMMLGDMKFICNTIELQRLMHIFFQPMNHMLGLMILSLLQY